MNKNDEVHALSDKLTHRQWRVINFALWRLIHEAYERANAAAQDKQGRLYKSGDAEKFLRDAEDAEAARVIVTAICAAKIEPPHEIRFGGDNARDS